MPSRTFDTFPLACYLSCYEMTIWIVLMRIVGPFVNMPVVKEHGGECLFLTAWYISSQDLATAIVSLFASTSLQTSICSTGNIPAP